MKLERKVPKESVKGKTSKKSSPSSSTASKNKQPKHKQPNSKLRVAKIVVIFLAVAALTGGIAYFGYTMYKQKVYNDKVNAIAAGASDIVNYVETVLKSKAPSTWVYDRDENLIMTLKLSDKLQVVDVVPTELQQTILSNAQGDVYTLVVVEYLRDKAIPVGEGTVDGYRKCLSANVSQEDILKYLATVSVYGNQYTGAIDACNNYLGLSIDQCNKEQLDFICAAYRNEKFDIDSYLDSKNTNEDRLGLVVHRSEYTATRSKILSELQSMENLDLVNKNYMVKLTTSTQQQSILQTIIDQGMRQLIDLNGDGTFAFDCSIVVIDRNSGYVRAYVPGRSATVSNAKPFAMNVLNFRTNFAQLYKELSDRNTFGFSLREVKKTNGDKELKSLKDLFLSGMLVDRKALDLVDPIGLVRDIYSNSPRFQGTSMIYQITDDLGNTLYKAKKDSILDLANNNLCQFFADDDNSTTFVEVNYSLDTGEIYMKSTADYVVLILAGSGAVGGSVTVSQRELLVDTVNKIAESVATFYPTPVNPVWDSRGMESAFAACYNKNQEFVQDKFIKVLDELVAIEVNSFATRVEFEQKYESINKMIDDYEVYIGEDFAEDLREAVQKVRLERSDLLIKFSV